MAVSFASGSGIDGTKGRGIAFSKNVIPTGVPSSIRALLVAGGGGGGGRSGGGGGAGGLIDIPSYSISSGTVYSVSVGGGGSGGVGDGSGGANGVNTYFGTDLIAVGGGYGARDGDHNGNSGGSGGGGKYGSSGSGATQPSQSGDSGTYGYGNSGGSGFSNPYAGGGGGGAGGVGIHGTSSGEIGDGGVGRYVADFYLYGGTNASNGLTGTLGYFAGGGGGVLILPQMDEDMAELVAEELEVLPQPAATAHRAP